MRMYLSIKPLRENRFNKRVNSEVTNNNNFYEQKHNPKKESSIEITER